MKKIYLAFALMMLCLTASAQWSENGVQPKPMGTNSYGEEYVVTPDGTIWYYYYHPSSTSVDDLATTTYEMRLQAITKDGVLLFGEMGKVVSNYFNRSWTQVNQYLCANSDNTVTLVVRDCRNSTAEEKMCSYTAYRFKADGTSVWDEDGVSIDNGMVYDDLICMTFCELSDGSTAFAWSHNCGDGGYAIEIQKVSKEGKCLYNLDDTRLTKANGIYTYPYMVPSDNGSFILVYAYSGQYYLRAMKYNSDGTKAWGSEVKVYGGGWGSILTLQTRMKIYPTPDNGVLVTWSDDRSNVGYYAPYLAYINSDGTSRFTNADGKPDVRLSYDVLSSHVPAIVFSADNNDIYVIFDQFAQDSQQWGQLSLQKVNKDGEILYGDNGVQLEPLAPINVGQPSVQLGEDGKLLCFWQQFYSYQHVDNVYSIRNMADGSAVNTDSANVHFRSSEAYRAVLQTTYSKADDTILLYWEENAQGSSEGSKTQCCLFSKMTRSCKELGTSGISNATVDKASDNTTRYDITGRILSTLKKGDIYIQGGKKYIAK